MKFEVIIMMSENEIEELKKRVENLEKDNKKLADSQVKLGEVTNNYMMLHYLNKNIHECDSSKKLWETYLHNITDSGFNYDNAYILLKNGINEEEEEFTTAVYLVNGVSQLKKIERDTQEKFVKDGLESLTPVSSEENTMVTIPVINSSKELKALLVVEKKIGITFEDIELLEIYAQQTVSQIDNILLNENLMYNQTLLGEKINQFVMLHYVSKDIHDSKRYFEVLEKYLRALTSEMGFNFKKSEIYIIDEEYNETAQIVCLKEEKLSVNHELVKLKDEFLEAAERRDTVVCNDEKRVVMPLISFNRVSAVINIENDKEISQEEIQLLEIFALQTAAILDNTKLNFNLSIEVEKRTKELKSAYEELKKMDKLKDEFLSMISHELRTPITSIMAYLETILSSLESDEMEKEMQEEFITIAFKESERLKKIVDDVIDLSKLESGTMDFSIERRDIEDILKKVCDKLQKDIKEKDIQIKKSIDLKNKIINADRIRAIQVLINVVSNAVKFSKKGKTVEINIVEREDKIIVSVKDFGEGIKIEDFNKVFSRFDQIEKVEHHNSGTGLGMPIAKHLMEKMGGEIWFESEIGKGSEFFVAFRKAECK
jgi:signal transduction histidine kinase